MKRTPSSGEGSGQSAEVKRMKEDGASGTASADREHAMLVKVMQISQPPAEKLSLATVGQFLEDETAKIARQHGPRGLQEGILFLARGWRRSEEGGVVPSTWAGIAPLQEAILTTSLAQLLAATADEKVAALTGLMENPVPVRLMNELLTAAAEDDAVPAKLLTALAGQLRGRTLGDQRSGPMSQLIRVLRSNKKYPNALVTSPLKEEIWRPNFESKFAWRNRKREVVSQQREGFSLQENTLLGWAMTPTPLDSGLSPPSKAHITEAGSTEWADLRRATRQRIDGLQRGVQAKLTGSQQQAAELVDLLLRAGDEPRMAVLEWIGAVMTGAEPRGRQGHVAPEGFNFWPQYGNHVIDVMGHAETSPFERSLKNLLMMQALQARIHGFPTSGCALNTFTLLLHLCKPIKPDQASSISVYFPSRPDLKDMLGNYLKEARFGEKEQVEAAMEVAKTDVGFTAAPADKALFKSEVFWLASRGMGSLLMPVAKEAFHAWQGIASAFYDKDPSISETAWREFLLAEASLKESSFLERLGHFVDLTFRFLQHAASNGQQTLPPPTPGPTWHAMPSSVLENVLELCDVYRERGERKKASGIPTGLFTHIDPDPVLTTLCIVMASDDHVKDPSLRGRAVKLLHRLCFAFQSWRDKLNQPPLDKQLIPCLVNVFIGVEKAIMSYYDLSYRYKYELRVPVMDLFDLALQHESHRQVLHQFTRGEGNDRFLKLLTQLINDSNSQTEEAIRTVKEYHEKKNETATSSASGRGSHDEQVLADDQTGDGDSAEDIYRRSRMNYKEHAKKYFGLATRTWKQLWLLCKLCAQVVVDGRTILEQLLHSSLDAQLHYLVGPEMKSIKASPQEYDELGFNPKDFVRQIAEMYLFLSRANRNEVVRIVGKDERYYSPTTFSKALNFVRKYGLLIGNDLEEFAAFCKELADKVAEQRAAFDEADIPENYLCEMMADIMSDPVQFPQSKKIVDRSVAERQIMGTDRDPYANTPVRVEDLIPLTELKEEIHRFAKEKGIVLEGGNMFG
eukprot:gb/GFBE01077844.1/.p1 GENE.gb/GFBE01077844.1/~~gb/GFBE01077844.1/.p1  ORF type:complete len:1023 (+),score=245.47 gb/GFBE01077844.1/:1-3069(+)